MQGATSWTADSTMHDLHRQFGGLYRSLKCERAHSRDWPQRQSSRHLDTRYEILVIELFVAERAPYCREYIFTSKASSLLYE